MNDGDGGRLRSAFPFLQCRCRRKHSFESAPRLHQNRFITFLVASIVISTATLSSHGLAAITNWQTGQAISGTESITLGDSMLLNHWNSDGHHLRYADFGGGLTLRNSTFASSWLEHAKFDHADVSRSYFDGARLDDATFIGSELNLARFRYAEANRVDFSHANLRSAILDLASFAGANFTNADLSDVNLSLANITGATFQDAVIDRIDLTALTFNQRGFSSSQLYSTDNYRKKNLRDIVFLHNDMTGWNFTDQDLRGANLKSTNLSNAKLDGANLTQQLLQTSQLGGASLNGTLISGTQFPVSTSVSQISQTSNYQQKNLRGIGLPANDLSNWDVSGFDLVSANLRSSRFSGTDLRGANLGGANLSQATGLDAARFSAETIYNQWTKWPPGFDPVSSGLTAYQTLEGDFNDDDRVDVLDLQVLHTIVLQDPQLTWMTSGNADMNGSGHVDRDDMFPWIERAGTWFGDVNFDGEFNSTDFVLVWQAGEFEDALVGNSTWSTGDWNLDGEFDTADLVFVFNYGGYEVGPRKPPRNANVPEPSSSGIVFAVLGLCLIAIRR